MVLLQSARQKQAEKALHRCYCCAHRPVCSGAVSSQSTENGGKTCTHMWALFRGRGLGTHCFQQMGVVGGGGGEMREGVCMCVEGGFWSMFFLCLSTSKLPLDLSSQDDRTHPCVCTFTLSLSYLSISSSLQSLSIPLPDKLSRCLFVFSLVTESIVTSLCFCIHLYRVQGWWPDNFNSMWN